MISVISIIFGAICVFYDFVLIILNPGTFLDNLTSFTHVWLIIGGFFIFLGIYRKKTGRSFWKSRKKPVKIFLASLCFIGFTFSFVSLIFILNPKIAKTNENCDYLILLGGGIDKNGNLPKPVLNRVEIAAEYLKENPNVICVATGGTLKWLPVAEAPELKNQLVKLGVSPEKILAEDEALDTIQNFQFSCQKLSEFTGRSKSEILSSKIVITTSKFHLRRAERLAKRMGFSDVAGLGAKCSAIYVVHNYLREILAYFKLNLRILFFGEPSKIVD